MYAFFKGKVEEIEKDRVIIVVNNIGYEINMTESDLFTLDINQEI